MEMETEKIWNESGWTAQIRQIILNFKKFPEDAKIILILRHSQRNEPPKLSPSSNLNLTPEGRKIAKILGKKLPKDKLIRLFHSSAERCRHTVEEIFEGVIKMGGKAVIKGQFTPLSHIGIDLEDFLAENEKYDIYNLFYRWVAGVYPPKLWSPLLPYCQESARQILEKLKSAPEKVLDIHITHDLHLLALRFGWFGLPPDRKWVDYLGGFAFILSDDHITLLDYGELKKVEYPHWWNNKII
jgi:phosphohistidine phosphatase SixA